jgi:putative addiction module component (TIGR02574 family)
MHLSLEQFGMDQLNPQQRWELIGLLWDSLPEDAVLAPPAWHLEELEKRITAADKDPEAGESWESVYQRLSRKS